MTRTAIIAAMPGELKPLVRGWQHECRDGVNVWRWRFDEGEWVAACAGAGVAAATRAFSEVEKIGSINLVVSAGWAGALNDQLEAGHAYSVSEVVDSRTGERFLSAGGEKGMVLVTSPKVADSPEKQRLASTYSAALVDMEAAVIARLARMRQIPFYCVKGISDDYEEQLPDFNRFILDDGRFLMSRFVLFCILRPWHWPALVRMGENSRKASQSISEALQHLLNPRGQIRERNGYPNHKR